MSICSCGKRKRFQKLDKGFFATCGDKECKLKSKDLSYRKTSIEKYGVDHHMKTDEGKRKVKENTKIHSTKNLISIEKKQQTNIEKYGVKHPMQSPSIKHKAQNTIKSNGGLRTDEIRNKKIKTSIEKYGVSNPMQNPLVSNKVQSSMREFYYERITESAKKINVTVTSDTFSRVSFKCNICNTAGELSNTAFNKRCISKNSPCIICNPPTYSSAGELELFNYIRTICPDAQKSKKYNRELDILCPSKSIAFEYNGLYWHSEACIHKEYNQNYHKEKKDFFEEKGINVIFIWEDEWINQKEIVKSRVKNILGVSDRLYARKCKIKQVHSDEFITFFDSNHIQGSGRTPSVCYGLYNESECVAMMSFIKYSNTWELLRYSTNGKTVIGGASKLMNHFIKVYNPLEIFSYADRCWSWKISNVYEQIGMKLVDTTAPGYKYWKSGYERLSRQKFMKHKLIKMGWGTKEQSEHEIMLSQKFYRIHDCGHLKYSIKL